MKECARAYYECLDGAHQENARAACGMELEKASIRVEVLECVYQSVVVIYD